MGILSLLGIGERKKKVLSFLANDAMIIDIRMPEEFDDDNLPGSINMLQENIELEQEWISSLGKPILLCCSSGFRSDEAVAMLQDKGIVAINAGSYNRLKKLSVVNNFYRDV